MIAGVGIDLVEVTRIERATRRAQFVSRILTPKERETTLTVPQIAGRWAAKEAVAKAVGLHLRWHQVEILKDDLGRPVVRIDGEPVSIHVSITHEKTHAAAVAIWER